MIKKLFFFFIILIFFYFYYFNKNREFYNYKNNILIIHNFYSNNDFSQINKYFYKFNPNKDFRLSSRRSLCINYEDNMYVYDKIYNNIKLKNLIKKLYNKEFKLNPSYPIEYRIYDDKSEGMIWHKDTSLFNPDCLEVVLTLDNSSDSKFHWIEDDQDRNIYTSDNTLVIVKPNTILHKVSPLNYGTRRILKFIIEFNDCKPNDNFYMELKNCPI
jgi:hypothetical protein